MADAAVNLPMILPDELAPVPGLQMPAAPLSRHALATTSAAKRAGVIARVEFVREVLRLVAGGMRQPEAVILAASQAERYAPLKPGNLNFGNFRTWRSKIVWTGKARQEVDWNATAKTLLDTRGLNARQRPGHEDFWEWFAKFYLNTARLSTRRAHELAREHFCKQHRAHLAGDVPELHQVEYHYATHVDQGEIVRARGGEEKYRTTVQPYIARTHLGVPVGALWVGDHHKFDCWCKLWDEKAQKWIAVRPWVTAWMDWRSQYFVGVRIGAGEAPNHLWIIEALLQAILLNGGCPPVKLATDNGKDYLKTGFVDPLMVGTVGHSICLELGIRDTQALPYNAASKTIERRFGIGGFAGEFAREMPGFWGANPQVRPEASERLVAEHPECLPSLQQFSDAVAHWLATAYHVRLAVDSKVLQGESPAALWAAREPLRPAMTEEALRLAFLLPLDTRRVRRGELKVRHPYLPQAIGDDIYRHPELLTRHDRELLVKINPWSAGAIWAYEPDGRLIAECRPPEQVPAMDAPRAMLQLAMHETRAPERDTRAAVAERQGLARPAVDAPPTPAVLAAAEQVAANELAAGHAPAVLIGTSQAERRAARQITGGAAAPAIDLSDADPALVAAASAGALVASQQEFEASVPPAGAVAWPMAAEETPEVPARGLSLSDLAALAGE